jgi:hypothetical protein
MEQTELKQSFSSKYQSYPSVAPICAHTIEQQGELQVVEPLYTTIADTTPRMS